MPPSKPKQPQPPQPKPARGRPRLTPEALDARIQAYCKRYGVAPDDGVLPPFPAGKRETAQHRQWIALYNAHKRLARREALEAAPRRPESGALLALVEAQRGVCPLCEQDLEPADAAADPEPPGAALHDGCLRLVCLARELGGAALGPRLERYLGGGRPAGP